MTALIMHCGISKLRAMAVTKRDGGEAVNAGRHGISYKGACDPLLEIPALRQRAWAVVLS